MITGGKNYWQEDSGDYQNSPWTAMRNGGSGIADSTYRQNPTPYTGPASTYQLPTGGGFATTQQGQSTAPQSGTPTPAAWKDVGLNFDGQNVQLPTISRSDFEWVDAVAPTWQQGDGGDYGQPSQWVGGTTGGWRLNEAARQRLGDMWTKDDQTSVAWDFSGPDSGTGASQFFGGGGMNQSLGYQNYMMGENGQRMKWVADPNSSGDAGSGSWQVDEGPGVISGDRDWLDRFFNQDSIRAAIKTGDKQGTGVGWRREGDSFVGAGKSQPFKWDTNPDHTQAALAFAALASMGLAAPLAGGAAAAEGGILGSGLTLGEIGQGINLMNFASGGQIPGLREAGLVTGLANGVSGVYNGISDGISGIGDAFDIAKSGVGAFNKGSQLMDMFSGGSNPPTLNKFGQPAAPSAGVPGMNYAGGSPTFNEGGGGNWSSFLDPLMRMGAGAWSEHQNRDTFRGLNDLASRVEQQRQPYIDRLRESYTNPNAYLESPEYKALAAVRGNQLNRGAAQSGRLANDVDREVLMQQHAQKGLSDYRQGLTSALSQHQLQMQPFMEAMRRNANAGGAAFGGAGYGGLPGIINGVAGGAGGVGGIVDIIRRAVGGGSGGAGTYNPGALPGGQEYIGSDEIPGGWGPAEISYGNFEGFNPQDTGMPENWNWDDSDSWDFTNWFDDVGSYWGIE